ncbi:uncharacterized protein LOC126355400 [Schistocerca gregaria]|uniref:uncharacterized protein LOC126355400 n=1 Tax=Schistocerca gregaria TaxID=7010 RepID=UPI00211DB711|nr:uncharacterized protein LOC126355400 [Schistocerca gregaria]
MRPNTEEEVGEPDAAALAHNGRSSALPCLADAGEPPLRREKSTAIPTSRGVCATESAARVARGEAFPGNRDGADRPTRMDVELRVRASSCCLLRDGCRWTYANRYLGEKGTAGFGSKEYGTPSRCYGRQHPQCWKNRENPRGCAVTFTRARAPRVSAQWNFLAEEKEGLGERKPAWANEALAAGRGARDPACLKNGWLVAEV